MVGGRARFRRHGIALRQDDEADPPVDAPMGETQLPGYCRNRLARVVEGSDPTELGLEGSASDTPREMLVLRDLGKPTRAAGD